MAKDLFGAREVLSERADGKLYYYRLGKLNEQRRACRKPRIVKLIGDRVNERGVVRNHAAIQATLWPGVTAKS